MTKKSIFIIVGTVLLLAGVSFAALYIFKADDESEYRIQRIEFTSMPASDEELLHWLKTQPDVKAVSIQRDDGWLLIRYELKVHHAAPDILSKEVLEKVEKLGYTGLKTFYGDKKRG